MQWKETLVILCDKKAEIKIFKAFKAGKHCKSLKVIKK